MALTTAPDGIRRTARAAIRSCGVTRAAKAPYVSPPGKKRQRGTAPRTKLLTSATPTATIATGTGRRSLAAPSTLATTSGGISPAV